MIYVIPIIFGLIFFWLLNKKQLTILIVIMYSLIAGLRSISVGYDTISYFHRFLSCTNYSFTKILSIFSNEPLYYLCCKFVNICGGDFHVLLLLIGILTMFALGKFIYKYSPNVIVSFTMLVSLQYYGFLLSAERQAIAMSIILLGTQFIFKRQFIKYLIVVAIAYNFHNSAILALPLYFCIVKKMTNLKRILALLLIPIIYIAKTPLFQYGLTILFSDYSQYAEEQGSNATLVLYLSFWSFYILTKKTDTNKIYNFFEITAIIGIIIQLFVPMEPNVFRVAFYYQIFNIVLLPIAISNLGNNLLIKKLGYFTLYIILGVMYWGFTYKASGINPYNFYWEIS